MSLIGQVETDVEIKAPAAMIHEIFSCRPHQISNLCPQIIQAVELLEGEWGRAGSIICWKYANDGDLQISKEIIVEIDNVNYSTTFKVIEGHLLDNYKSFYFIVQATPKGEGSLFRWTFKYEKLNEHIPEPKYLIPLAIEVTKNIDAHLNPQPKAQTND